MPVNTGLGEGNLPPNLGHPVWLAARLSKLESAKFTPNFDCKNATPIKHSTPWLHPTPCFSICPFCKMMAMFSSTTPRVTVRSIVCQSHCLCYLRKELHFWKVHGFISCKVKVCSMKLKKLNKLLIFTFYYKHLIYRNYL